MKIPAVATVCILLVLMMITSIEGKAVSMLDSTPPSQEESYHSDSDKSFVLQSLRETIIRTMGAFQAPIVKQAFEKIIQLQEEEEIPLRFPNSDSQIDLQNLEMSQSISDSNSRSILSTMASEPMNCDETSLLASFENVTYICRNASVTKEEYDILIVDPNNYCHITNDTVYACMCPLDRYGILCNHNREFQCVVQMLSPAGNCESPPEKDAYGGLELDGDFPCHRYSMKDNVEFRYNMTCKFTQPPYTETAQRDFPRNATYTIYTKSGPEEMTWDQIQQSFVYFLNHKYKEQVNGTEQVVATFALTKPLSEPLRLKVFNFVQMSDTSGYRDTPLDLPEYYYGEKVATFPLQFADMSEILFAGNRLYCEVRIPNIENLYMPWERIFIDFNDRPLQEMVNKRAVILSTVVPLASIATILATILTTALCYAKKRREKKELKTD